MDHQLTDHLGHTNLEARPYQVRIIQKTLDDYHERNLRSVLIESPCGSGKTSMALMICKILEERYGTDLEVGWFSMRRNLLAQAEAENKEKAINARVRFISMFAKELPQELLKGRKGKRVRMIVIDEAQHDAANTMASVHSKIQADIILGMTATPFRSDCVKLTFDVVNKDAGLAPLIKDGYLSKYHHYTIPTWGVKETVETYLQDRARFGKTVMYYHRIEQAHEAANMLTEAGVPAEAVTGATDRFAQLDRFDTGETQVLTNCLVLTEGMNCTSIQSVFVKPSCKGVTIQMAGRAFRKHPGIPHKNVVQAKKGWPFIKLVSPETQWVRESDEWRSLSINPNINRINCRMLVVLSKLDTQLPEFLTKRNKKRKGGKAANDHDY